MYVHKCTNSVYCSTCLPLRLHHALDVGNESVSGFIAGLSILFAILVTLVVILVLGVGLCYCAIKRRRQADIMTDRLNGKQHLPHHASVIDTIVVHSFTCTLIVRVLVCVHA